MRQIKRLKIIEQISIIVLLSVFIPMIIAGFIVNNINQHAIRAELSYSVQMIAQTIQDNIVSMMEGDKNRYTNIIVALKYIPKEEDQIIFLKDIAVNSEMFKDFDIVRPSDIGQQGQELKRINYNPDDSTLYILEKINDNKYLKIIVNVEFFKDKVLNFVKDDSREIYIINKDNRLLFSHNFNEADFEETMKLLPKDIKKGKPMFFGISKNQPRIYLTLDKLNLTIIVNTPKEMTESTIYTARFKIILAFLISAIVTIILTGLYCYYLYINIKQLFKGIIALSKGNYKRQVKLLTNVFTPYEIIFLAFEFNKMVNEINNSYKQLKNKNKELKQLNEFRSDLIDTVSHEFRTPLTSIKGYTSRLLRKDIEIDEETKNKSLRIIKQQAERLSRMVEDLLVIPDIEGARLNIEMSSVSLPLLMESAIYSVKNIEKREVINNIPSDFPALYADKDRLEQVLINLIDNANKYGFENTPITVSSEVENHKAIIKITNKSEYIDKDKLNKLFDKFIRMELDTTRSTRGTGLGLYIVKGLVNAMNGSIYLQSTEDENFTVYLIFPLSERIDG
ncbi:GHKL domain-containing protein [bacterium]|nr:GHKL domain-containing protein [bacterium]